MCIFSKPVISVNNTQIFARLTEKATQFLAYQMTYESRDENAMILPFPVRQPVREDSLRFIDLKEYPELFADLDKGFPYRQPMVFGCSTSHAKLVKTLEVFKVGNYVASFVPSVADFSRLDERFRLPESTWSQIPRYKDFGFAVFQLAAGALTPHPMALEFECTPGSIYFPTMHIHDGEIHPQEHFDHVLYLQHAGFDSNVGAYQNSDVVDQLTGLFRSVSSAKHFCEIDRTQGLVQGDLLVHRQIIRGKNVNRDTEIAVTGDPIVPAMNLRLWLSYAPWVVVGSAVAWFLARRAKIKSRKNAENS